MMSNMRAFAASSIVIATLVASLGFAAAQSGGGSLSGGSSGAGSTGGATGGASVGAAARAGVARPDYSATTPAGPASSSGVAGPGSVPGGSVADGDPDAAISAAGGKTIRCPDGSIGKTGAGGCLGGETSR